MAFVILFVMRIPFRKVKRKGEAEEATFFGMLEQGRVKAQKKKQKTGVCWKVPKIYDRLAWRPGKD